MKPERLGEKYMKTLLSFILAVALSGISFAQEIKDRRENQQDRIANGVASGQLTAGETAKLEKQEANINKEIARDRAANGGNLTARQKAQINRQLNRESARIYNKKHNSATGPH